MMTDHGEAPDVGWLGKALEDAKVTMADWRPDYDLQERPFTNACGEDTAVEMDMLMGGVWAGSFCLRLPGDIRLGTATTSDPVPLLAEHRAAVTVLEIHGKPIIPVSMLELLEMLYSGRIAAIAQELMPDLKPGAVLADGLRFHLAPLHPARVRWEYTLGILYYSFVAVCDLRRDH